jgi:WD40 repeat protein
MDFLPDGRHLIATDAGGRVHQLGERDSNPPPFEVSKKLINDVAVDPRGAAYATAGDDGVRVWRPRSATLQRRLLGHVGPVNGVAYSHDGLQLATVGSDRTVRIWESDTGVPRGILRTTAKPYAASFSPDRELLAVGADDGLTIWDWRRRVRLVQLSADQTQAVAFGRRARIEAVGYPIGGSRQFVREYRCDACIGQRDLLGFARSRATRRLSQEERQNFLAGVSG